jgi:hypothetical protein
MLSVIGGVIFIFGLYLLYMAVSFFKIPDSDYKKYKSSFSGFLNTVIGSNLVEEVGEINGDGRSEETGELNIKSSYSPEHTKKLLES